MQFGSTINPALGRTDYSAYTQGAAQGAQAIGQGIQQLGQGIGAAIKQYRMEQEKKDQEQSAEQAVASFAIQNPEEAKQIGLTDPTDKKLVKHLVKSFGGAAPTFQVINQFSQMKQQKEEFGMKQEMLAAQVAEQNKQRSIEAARNAFILGQNPTGVYSPEVLNAAQVGRMEFEGKMAPKSQDAFQTAKSAFMAQNPNAAPAQLSDFVSSYQAGSQPPKPFEDESTKQRAQVMAKMFQGDIAKGDSARTMLSNYSKVKDLLKGGVKTGAFEESKLKAVSFLKSLGVEVDQTKLANSETAKALMGSSLIEWFDRTKGSISNSENSLFQSFGPEFAKSEQGNKLLIEAAEERLKVDTDLSRIASSGYENGLSDAEIMKNRNKRITEYDKKLESIKAEAESVKPTTSQGIPSHNDIQAEIARRKAAKVK